MRSFGGSKIVKSPVSRGWVSQKLWLADSYRGLLLSGMPEKRAARVCRGGRIVDGLLNTVETVQKER